MNIVDYIIIAVLAYGLLAGMYKGMITSGLSVFGFLGAWYGAKVLSTEIAQLALGNTTLMAVLNQYLEPETFFESSAQAAMSVHEVAAGGEAAITAAAEAVSANFGFISDAFMANIRHLSFEKIGISTLSDYFNQTLWVAVFNVAAFVIAFIVLYFAINLFVNLLDRVISWPVLRGFDWLVGGICGLIRASVVVVLVLNILPAVTTLLNPELTKALTEGSQLYSVAMQFDLLSVGTLVKGLIHG